MHACMHACTGSRKDDEVAVSVCAQEHGRYYLTPPNHTCGALSDPLFGAPSDPMVL